jgi:hypothetical protein
MAKEQFYVWTMSNGQKDGEYIEADSMLEAERIALLANLENLPEGDLEFIKSEMKTLLTAMDIHVE